MDEALSERLSAIERRLAELEQRLPRRPWAGPVSPESVAATPPPVEPSAAVPPPLPRTVPPVTFDELTLAERVRIEGKRQLLQDRQSPRPQPQPPVVEPGRRPAGDASALERLVGLTWAGRIGAAVLVIGLALGVKFAYDQGYFGGLPPVGRCALVALAGVLLLAIGEWVYRRVHRVAAAGPYGAGVATLFLAAYAGQAWYGLFAPPTALAMMAAAAAVGVLVAARTNLVAVAGLAILGGGACPLFFGDLPTNVAGLLTYVLFLQALAVGLCGWRVTPQWWVLRGLSLAVTAFWTLVLALAAPALGTGVTVLVLSGVSAALYQGELLLTAWRRSERARASDAWPGPAFGRAAEASAGVTFSLLVTATLTAAWLLVLHLHSASANAQVLTAMAAAAAVTSFIVARVRPWRPLARGFALQSVALVALAVALGLDGGARVAGWLALSAALAVLGAVHRDRAALVAGGGVWAIAAFAWLTWTGDALDRPGMDDVWFTLGGVGIDARLGAAAMLAAVAHGMSVCWRRVTTPGSLLVALPVWDGIAAAVLGIGLVAETPMAFATVGGLAYAWALALASRTAALRHVGPVAIAVLAATAAKWAGADVAWQRFSAVRLDVRPFGSAQVLIGFALALSAVSLVPLVTRDGTRGDADDARRDLGWTLCVTAAFLLVGLTLGVRAADGVGRAAGGGDFAGWPRTTATQFFVTVIVAACLAGWHWTLHRTLRTAPARDDVRRAGGVLALLVAVKFVTIDVFGPYVVAPGAIAATVGWNLQVLAGGCVALLAAALAGPTGRVAVLAVLLVAGSAEIDRYAVGQHAGPAWIVRQAGWSVYWAVLAVLSLLFGLVWASRELRVAGLVLLGVTLAKVMTVDLSGAGTGWRIVSVVALGAVLLATSVLYGRFHRAGENGVEGATV